MKKPNSTAIRFPASSLITKLSRRCSAKLKSLDDEWLIILGILSVGLSLEHLNTWLATLLTLFDIRAQTVPELLLIWLTKLACVVLLAGLAAFLIRLINKVIGAASGNVASVAVTKPPDSAGVVKRERLLSLFLTGLLVIVTAAVSVPMVSLLYNTIWQASELFTPLPWLGIVATVACAICTAGYLTLQIPDFISEFRTPKFTHVDYATTPLNTSPEASHPSVLVNVMSPGEEKSRDNLIQITEAVYEFVQLDHRADKCTSAAQDLKSAQVSLAQLFEKRGNTSLEFDSIRQDPLRGIIDASICFYKSGADASEHPARHGWMQVARSIRLNYGVHAKPSPNNLKICSFVSDEIGRIKRKHDWPSSESGDENREHKSTASITDKDAREFRKFQEYLVALHCHMTVADVQNAKLVDLVKATPADDDLDEHRGFLDLNNYPSIFNSIRSVIGRFRGKRNVIVDITSGKKTYSAAAMLACLKMDVWIGYVDTIDSKDQTDVSKAEPSGTLCQLNATVSIHTPGI